MENNDFDMMDEEKRSYPRKKKELPLNLIVNDSYVALGETVNLSCIGAYCKTTKNFPEMTRLRIAIVLPFEGKDTKSARVECTGVIVRAERDRPGTDTYKLAIYFDDIDKDEMNKIKQLLGNN